MLAASLQRQAACCKVLGYCALCINQDNVSAFAWLPPSAMTAALQLIGMPFCRLATVSLAVCQLLPLWLIAASTGLLLKSSFHGQL